MSDITTTLHQPSRKRIHIRKGKITCVSGVDAGNSWEVDHDVVSIGSKEGSGITLNDSAVSRRHAEVRRDRDGVLLCDCGSTNGTFVGPVRVKEVFLTPETHFKVGTSELVFTPHDEVIEITPSTKRKLGGMVGDSTAIREVFSIIDRVAPTDLTVLITGETGTGKELACRAVHEHSRRSGGNMVVFDCGAAAKTLIEAELFGHEKGAFTGATTERSGVFEQADNGTIFLDEIGELPLELQPKLLRVLEQREVRRVGSGKIRPINVRVVAATNRDLLAEVRKGNFREDLYYRLAVVEVHLPPLRERMGDIPRLAEHLLARATHNSHIKGIESAVEGLFLSYHWPGNIREMVNVIERAIPFTDGDQITMAALPAALKGGGKGVPNQANAHIPKPTSTEMPFKDAKEQLIDAFERQYLVDLIDRHNGNVSKAARAAHMDRKSITRLLKKHGIR